MKFYQEITIMPNNEIDKHFIFSKLFTQIHFGLVSIQDDQNKSPIGISFPEYFMGEKFGLGSKLRLFAHNESELIKFDASKLMSRLSDYVHTSGISKVPEQINGYAVYNRYQPRKINKERLARRYAKRHKLDYETALKHYDDMKEEKIELPFLNLKSLSTGNEFCLWIKKTKIDQPSYQKFSTYGLSKISTIPEF
jgi:CRISPR-associated endonuclease Csy4